MTARIWIALAAAFALISSATVSGHDGKDHGASEDPDVETVDTSRTPDARAYFTDTLLLNQHGEQVRFYSDVLEGRVVLLNVIYTECPDACPLITQKIKQVRDAIDEPIKSMIHFISISSDPETDSPQALRAFAQKHKAEDPNWIFLTGEKANVDAVLMRLGQLSQTPEGHSTLLIAGDVPNKRWSKIRPDAPAVAIAERLKLLAVPVGGG